MAHLVLELPGLDGGVRPPVTLDGVRVLVLTCDAVVLSTLLTAHSHVLVVVHIPEAVIDDAINHLTGAKLHAGSHGGQVVRDVAHALETASELRARAEHYVLRSIHRSLHSASAHLVDGGALSYK